MRKISKSKDKKLREEQFRVFVDILSSLRTRLEIEKFVLTLLSESEKNYISQRLNIMRMVGKYFPYSEIEEKLGVPSGTIANTKKIWDESSISFKQFVNEYRHKDGVKSHEKKNIDSNKPHYPGAIKL